MLHGRPNGLLNTAETLPDTMNPASDRHLEESLKDFNDRVSEYETEGTNAQLLDAYVNRGCVLSMMGSYVSALDDFDEADLLIRIMESAGESADAGVFVKTYISRGELRAENDAPGMAEDYARAAERIDEADSGNGRFDGKTLVNACLGCCADLLEAGYPSGTIPFTEKAEKILAGKNDVWSLNRYVETMNTAGQAALDLGNPELSLEYLDRAISVCGRLMSEEKLEDVMSAVSVMVSRGDAHLELSRKEDAVKDFEGAVTALEILYEQGREDAGELLIGFHRDVAEILMSLSETEKAEVHLIKALKISAGER